MKPFRFTHLPIWALIICLSSCGGNQQKTETSTSSNDTTGTSTTTTSTSTTTAAVGSTIITTPQNVMVARQKVNDFSKWKAFYESRDSNRLANGVHNYVIGRGVQDSNMILVAMRIDDVSKAKTYSKEPGIKQGMQKAGITGAPTFEFITMTFQDTANISSDIRSVTMFNVKDWNTWQKAFDSGKQMRIDNGMTDRAYGHDVDDNHKVVVVVAVNDTAKAMAFWKSDMLKQRRAHSGVIGEPKRFVYRITQRY